MKHFALIGRRLGHSWSQRWFTDLFTRLGLDDHSYSLNEMPTLDGLRQWVETEGINGFNVTIPYKQEILPYLDETSPDAAAIGAVNCVCVENGRLVGHNTDAPAFRDTIRDLLPAGSAIILGTGGAARAVSHALGQLGVEHLFVSRHPENMNAESGEMKAIGYDQLYTDLKQLATSTILINATPVGMWPNVDSSPWPWPEQLSHFKLVYDLIYNPSPTLLLQQAAQSGATCQDGLAMLHRQAALSWQLWQRDN